MQGGEYLGGETVVTGYDDFGRTTTLKRATILGSAVTYGASYAAQPTFDDDGRLTVRPLGSGSYTYRAERRYEWDQFGRLDRMFADRLTGPDPTVSLVQNDNLAYDSYGNVSSLVSNPDGVTFDERQCFTYNTRQQLVRAYSIALESGSASTSCAVTSPASTQAPYDQSFDYDAANRMTKGPAGATYTYSSEAHPHGVTQTVSGSASVGTRNLDYDADGNVTEIERVGLNRHLMTWDPQGRLLSTTVKDSAGVVQSTISNIYDVDRQRIISTTDAAGATNDTVTVTLPGMDFTIGRNASGTATMVSANQYKTIGGANVAIRSRTGNADPVVQWVLGNYQGSVAVTINASTGAVARNWYTPYGNERDTTGTTTSDRAFLNQERDTTGVNYLTNRYYDPRIGAFLSVDPLVAQTTQPYLYGSGNPTTSTDPSGLEPCSLSKEGCTSADYGTGKTNSGTTSNTAKPISSRPKKKEPWWRGYASPYVPTGTLSGAASQAGVSYRLLWMLYAQEGGTVDMALMLSPIRQEGSHLDRSRCVSVLLRRLPNATWAPT